MLHLTFTVSPSREETMVKWQTFSNYGQVLDCAERGRGNISVYVATGNTRGRPRKKPRARILFTGNQKTFMSPFTSRSVASSSSLLSSESPVRHSRRRPNNHARCPPRSATEFCSYCTQIAWGRGLRLQVAYESDACARRLFVVKGRPAWRRRAATIAI